MKRVAAFGEILREFGQLRIEHPARQQHLPAIGSSRLSPLRGAASIPPSWRCMSGAMISLAEPRSA